MDNGVRKSIVFPHEMYQEMDDFRFSERISIEVDAIRTLVQMGLHYYKLKQDPVFAQQELDAIDRLNNALAE
jgi:hypothetical protein